MVIKKPYETETILDYGLASENEKSIINFLDKIYLIPLENPEEWEKEMFKFFSEEVIVPYVITTSIKEDDSRIIEHIKEKFLKRITRGTLIWDSNDIYKDLVKIRNSLKAGMKLKHYLPFFFMNNNVIKGMFIKKTDEEDSQFKNFGHSIKRICYELETKDKIIGYETIYFIVPDKDLDYPTEEWHKKISEGWRKDLNSKLNPKKENKRKRNPIESRLRHEVFKRDNYKCRECGKGNKETTLHADHVLPVSRGGKDELDNLQALCEACNLAKSDKFWEENGKKE